MFIVSTTDLGALGWRWTACVVVVVGIGRGDGRKEWLHGAEITVVELALIGHTSARGTPESVMGHKGRLRHLTSTEKQSDTV